MKVFRCLSALSLAVLAVVLPTADAARNRTAVIDIVGFNDVYEMLQDDVNGFKVGGPSRVIPIVKDMRAKNQNSLVIFAGDTMSPSLWSLQFKGMQMVDAHNALTVDVACLGNHEFDFGVDAFFNVSRASNFPWLNANCYEYATGALLRGTVARTTKTLSDPTYGTVKIGFFGVMYDMKMPGNRLYWTDPIEAAKKQVKLLREVDKVDMVIALTHQELAADNQFSKEVKGVDLIYAGHDHAAMLQTDFGAPYLKADLDFRTIWSSRVEYYAADKTNTAPALRMDHKLVQIREELPTDPAFEAVIAKYNGIVAELSKREVGTLCAPLDLQQKTVRTSDCAVGAVFADAAIHLYGPNFADAALINGGVIRSDKIYPAGKFTLGDLIAWSPFGNTLIVIETNGASVKKFLASQAVLGCGADGFVGPNGSYMHAGGIKYLFKCTGDKQGELASVEWFKHPTFKGPVLDTDVIKFSTSNYMFANAWVTVPGLVITKTLVSEAESLRIDAALEKFVKALPDQTLCYKAEGRSVVTV
jgi:2',3'-cyclic-nucleotide 2'-phosphodiesterase (5'-nucleotidase family)